MTTAAVTYTFAANTLIESAKANTNFQDLVDYLNDNVIVKDASTAFTVIPSGPSSDPTTDDQFARKAYVDDAALGGFRLKPGVTSATTDASGYVTVTHSAGFTPTVVVATGKSPISGADIPASVVCDTYGATTFRARFLNGDGSALGVVAVAFSWIACAAST